MSTGGNVTAGDVTFIGPQGETMSTRLDLIDAYYHGLIATAITKGAEIGALFILLVVMLIMTPSKRYKMNLVKVNMSALVLTLIRMTLIACYTASNWANFYVTFSGSYSSVPRVDYNTSVAATICNVLVTLLIQIALMMQAYSVLRAMTKPWKILLVTLSALISLATFCMCVTITVIQVRFVLHQEPNNQPLIRAFLAVLAASITWYTLLFIMRLVSHMWKTRSTLPSFKGLNAMDSLVMCNAVLMIVPVFFVSLQLSARVDFFAYTMAQTSVVIVLPLASLWGQRLSSPSSFDGSSGGGVLNVNSSNASGGGASQNSRRPLLMMLRGNSNPGRPASAGLNGNLPGGLASDVTVGRSGGTIPPAAAAARTPYDRQLDKIDNIDVEQGLGGIHVERRIDTSVKRL